MNKKTKARFYELEVRIDQVESHLSQQSVNPSKKKRWSWFEWSLIIVAVLWLGIIGVRAAIRMIDDPKPAPITLYRIKCMNVSTGTYFWENNRDSTFKVGEMYIIDSSGYISPTISSFWQTKCVIIQRLPQQRFIQPDEN